MHADEQDFLGWRELLDLFVADTSFADSLVFFDLKNLISFDTGPPAEHCCGHGAYHTACGQQRARILFDEMRELFADIIKQLHSELSLNLGAQKKRRRNASYRRAPPSHYMP
jgi:hypothetical protein